MNHPWRCLACAEMGDPTLSHGRDFEAPEPRCPDCGAEPPLVTPLVRVHFIVMDPAGAMQGFRGRRQYVACAPKLRTMGQHVVASGDPIAVTCPECKQHEQYKKESEVMHATAGGFLLAPSSRPLAQE